MEGSGAQTNYEQVTHNLLCENSRIFPILGGNFS
jgi:hypothetical protein